MVLTRLATGGNRQFHDKTYDLWEKVFADLQQVPNLTGLADYAADEIPPTEVLQVSALFLSLSLCLYMYIYYLSIYLGGGTRAARTHRSAAQRLAVPGPDAVGACSSRGGYRTGGGPTHMLLPVIAANEIVHFAHRHHPHHLITFINFVTFIILITFLTLITLTFNDDQTGDPGSIHSRNQ